MKTEWTQESLTEVCDFRGGTQPPKSTFVYQPKRGYVRLLQIRDFSSSNHATYIHDEPGLRKCVEDDVLLGRYGASVGKVLRGKAGAYNVAICKVVPDESRLTKDFLFFYLHSQAFQSEIVNLGGERGVQAGFNKSDLSNFQIPLPPLAEQRRLVKRLQALTSRAQELRALNASLVEDATRLLAAEYNRICRDAPTQPFGKVANLVRRSVQTQPDESYHETGIRSFGKGTFHKPALTGRQLGNKRVFRIRPGDLVFMNVFAWEGAIAVAKPEDDGRVASHRFMMHEVDPAQATAEFLCYHLLTEHGMEHIRAASPGSAGRNRTLGITKLHAIPVPVPPVEAQRRFSKLHALRDKLRRLQTETEAELAAFTPALLAKAFRGEL